MLIERFKRKNIVSYGGLFMDGKGQTLFWFHNEKVKVEVPFF